MKHKAPQRLPSIGKIVLLSIVVMTPHSQLLAQQETVKDTEAQLQMIIANKKSMAFPISKPIHGYRYGQVIELVERPDGLIVKADSEYKKAAEHIEYFWANNFYKKVSGKYEIEDVVIPKPSTEMMFVEEDVVFAKWDKRAMLLNIYGPKADLSKKFPVIIIVHGGGWGLLSHKTCRSLAINLAKRGFLTITPEYRLSGEAPLPAAVYDIKACIRWIRANAQKYNFDVNAIGITGGSAGGHLAALVGVTNEDMRFEGTDNNLSYSSNVHAILSFYGPFSWIYKQTIGTEVDGGITLEEVYPDYHIRKGSKFPPILCINESSRTASHENWGEGTVEWIKENNAGEASFTIYDAPHGFIDFAPFQEEAIERATTFFYRVFEKTNSD